MGYRQSKEERIREEGVTWAANFVLEHDGDVQELIKEMKWRGMLGVPLGVKKSEVKDFERRMQVACVSRVLCVALLTLHDEFGFGKKRLEKFQKRYNLKADVLIEDFSDWEEYVQILKDECDIELNIDLK